MNYSFDDLPELVGLDIDGIMVLSIVAKLDGENHLSSKIPIIKRTILNIGEIIERIAPIKYELADFKSEEMRYLYESVKHARNVVIITNRSTFGFNTLLKRIPNFEKMVKGYNINRIQVRKSMLDSEQPQMTDYPIKIIRTSDIKPNETVLYPLINYAERNGIRRNKILIADDNRWFRAAAMNLGINVFPDDIIMTKINQIKLEKDIYAPHLLTQ